MEVTPFFLQASISLSLILRDAPVTSGVLSPTPPQNSFMPPPVPVDSTTGVLNFPVLPNFSATAVVNGNTVDDPTTSIWSRASAAPAVIASPARAAKATDMRFIASPSGLIELRLRRPQSPAPCVLGRKLGRFRDTLSTGM